MNRLSRISVIIKKELKDFRKEPNTFMPLIVLPLLFGILLPVVIIYATKDVDFHDIIFKIPLLQEKIPELMANNSQNSSIALLKILLMTIFLPVFILISVITAITTSASSFAGEYVEKTLEGLLYTPLTNKEIVGGKAIASLLPSLFFSWFSVALYMIVCNVYIYNLYGSFIILDEKWFLMVVLLIPLIAVCAIELIIFVSQRAKTVKSAGSMVSLLLLPIMSTLIAQIMGIFIFGALAMIIVSLILLIFDGIGFLILAKFDREKMLIGYKG